MAKTRAMALMIAMLALFALLLAGCSGSFKADDDDGDESDGGVTFDDDDEDNDAPGAALGVIVTSLGLAGALRRRNQ